MDLVTTAHHLAQVNVGRLSAPLDSEQIRPFMELLAPINAIAAPAAMKMVRYSPSKSIIGGGEPMLPERRQRPRQQQRA